MSSVIINSGEHFVSKSPNILESVGIGSCVCICLYEKNMKIGGLVHAMLPKFNESKNSKTVKIQEQQSILMNEQNKFVDTGFEMLLNSLKIFAKSSILKLEAKIIGGSEMFSRNFYSVNELSMGTRNIQSAKEILLIHQIPLVASDVGGTVGRSIKFFLDSGIIEVKKL